MVVLREHGSAEQATTLIRENSRVVGSCRSSIFCRSPASTSLVCEVAGILRQWLNGKVKVHVGVIQRTSTITLHKSNDKKTSPCLKSSDHLDAFN